LVSEILDYLDCLYIDAKVKIEKLVRARIYSSS